MNKTISANVTEDQYDIIKKIAEINNLSISQITKESVKIYIALYHVSDMLNKIKIDELTQEVLERNTRIMTHAEEMVKLMQPYFTKAISSIPKDVIKALEEQGKEFSSTLKKYERPVKRGRPPALIQKKPKEK